MSHSATKPGTAILTILAVILTLAGCQKSKTGDGSPPQDDLAALEATNPLLPDNAEKIIAQQAADTSGVAVQSITSLVVEPTVDGVIIRTEGLAERQGAYDARLIPVPQQDASPSTLAYTFKVYYPRANTAVGSEESRKIQVALSLTVKQLEGVRVIRVSSETNSRETRRR